MTSDEISPVFEGIGWSVIFVLVAWFFWLVATSAAMEDVYRSIALALKALYLPLAAVLGSFV